MANVMNWDNDIIAFCKQIQKDYSNYSKESFTTSILLYFIMFGSKTIPIEEVGL